MIELELWDLRLALGAAAFIGYQAGRFLENRREQQYCDLRQKADNEKDPAKKNALLLKWAERIDEAKYRNAFVSAKFEGRPGAWFAVVVFLHQVWRLAIALSLYFFVELMVLKTDGRLLVISLAILLLSRLVEKIMRKTKGLPE